MLNASFALPFADAAVAIAAADDCGGVPVRVLEAADGSLPALSILLPALVSGCPSTSRSGNEAGDALLIRKL